MGGGTHSPQRKAGPWESPNGKCALCGKWGGRLHSHILPKLLFRHLGGKTTPKVEGPRIRRGRPGHIKQYLLCPKCEGVFNKWEATAGTWYENLRAIDTQSGAQEITLHGLNHQHLKLFYLSVLWRFEVSDHEQTKRVNLGPKEAEIKQMLLEEDAGPDTKMPVIGALLRGTQTQRENIIALPQRARVESRYAHMMYARGLAICWITGGDGRSGATHRARLETNGTWWLPILDEKELVYCP